MNDLKSFAFQVEQMRMAQTRCDDLTARIQKCGKPEDYKAWGDVTKMKRQLENAVDASLAEIKKDSVRIAPEQVDADTNLLSALETSVNAWSAELEVIQKELIDQAIIDAKSGEKSSRYLTLEKRESDLKKLIAEADEKLGKVTDRMMSPGFGNTVQQIIDNVKP